MIYATLVKEDQFRVDIGEELKKAVDSVFDRQGTTRKEGASRLFRWFVSLDTDLQAAVLGQIHSGELIGAIARRLSDPPTVAHVSLRDEQKSREGRGRR